MFIIFCFFIFLILLNLLNKYLNMRESMENCEVQNFSANKQTILKNAADIKVISENLKNSMDKFYIFDRKTKKNESNNWCKHCLHLCIDVIRFFGGFWAPLGGAGSRAIAENLGGILGPGARLCLVCYPPYPKYGVLVFR